MALGGLKTKKDRFAKFVCYRCFIGYSTAGGLILAPL